MGFDPYLERQKAHVPEGRYQTPSGIHLGLVQSPDLEFLGLWTGTIPAITDRLPLFRL